MDQLLSGLGNRVFLMNNVHEDQPMVFQTRWALSYLRGPLTREQIQTLMAPRKRRPRRDELQRKAGTHGRGRLCRCSTAEASRHGSGSIQFALGTTDRRREAGPLCRRTCPSFSPRRGPLAAGRTLLYRPPLLGVARLHYADKKAGVDHWETLGLLRPIGEEMPADIWKERRCTPTAFPSSTRSPETGRDASRRCLAACPVPSAMPSGPKT